MINTEITKAESELVCITNYINDLAENIAYNINIKSWRQHLQDW